MASTTDDWTIRSFGKKGTYSVETKQYNRKKSEHCTDGLATAKKAYREVEKLVSAFAYKPV